VDRLRQAHPGDRLFWLLIAAGYRTYRFLPVFWKRFFPRHEEATPPDVQRLLDALATERFASAYRPAQGVVRFVHPHVLRCELLTIPEDRLADPHVAFFVSADNLTPAGRRIWRT
jgi:hypothetical protein